MPEKNLKVLLAVHRDFDGVVSAIILKNIFPNAEIISGTYKNINEKFAKAIKEKDWDLIFIADISIDESQFVEFLTDNSKVHIIDHHPRAGDTIIVNNYLTTTEGSACLMVKNYVEKHYPEKFKEIWTKKLYALMTFGNDYDLWIHEHKISKYLNRLYYKINFDEFVERFIDGFGGFNEEEKKYLQVNEQYLQKLFNELEYINVSEDVILTITDFGTIDEIAEYIKGTHSDVDTVFIYNSVSKSLSIRMRNKIEGLHCGEFLRQFEGGGHETVGAVRVSTTKEMEAVIGKYIEEKEQIKNQYNTKEEKEKWRQ
jgi:oligoribonuclease NrnB/cAMP/cGMP phosphodiesterase (DHH superfamily)